MIHSSANSVFLPGVFQSGVSLSEKIEQISDPKTPLTPQRVADMVASYVFGYIYPESIGEKVSEKELHNFFTQAHRYHKEHRGEKSQIDEFEGMYSPYQYQVGMAGDIASTVEILLDILSSVRRVVRPSPVNVEVGTGTGILQLGRYIWARRNGTFITPENNIGIETVFDVFVRSNEVLGKLGVGRVEIGDSTCVDIFVKAGVPKEVDFFTNENIPRFGHRLSQEPFLQNMLNFARYIGFENFAKVIAFPQLTRFVDRKTNQESIFGISPQKDVEFLALLASRRPDFESDMISMGLSVGEVFYDDQAKVGDAFLVGTSPIGFINEFPYWYHRWKKKR